MQLTLKSPHPQPAHCRTFPPMAFVATPFLGAPIARPHTPHRISRRASVVARASSDGELDWAKHDTLTGFEALCIRAQSALCAQTAAADGLGTFEATPSTAPRSPRTHVPHRVYPSGSRARSMRGGRAFERAVVNVWRSRPAGARRRLLAELGPGPVARVAHATDGVGLSLRLQPRDPTAPALRADVHYFQLGGGATVWWFAGAADLALGPRAPPNSFQRDVRAFLASCRAPCAQHRASDAAKKRVFLEGCLTGEQTDRASAFAFVVDVVDLLLPSYLPLVRGDAPSAAATPRLDDTRSEFVERFGLKGGASCESEVAHAAALGWWRFTLAPRVTSPEGRRFWSMRNDENSGRTPPAYL